MPASTGAATPGVHRLGTPGLVHYIAYGPVWARAAGQPDVLGFGPVGSSLSGPSLADCDRWFGAYASPVGSGAEASVCRLVDEGLALVAVRGQIGGDPRLDARGYLLVGNAEDLTAELALRLSPGSSHGAVLKSAGPGSGGDQPLAGARGQGGERPEASFAAAFETLARIPDDPDGRDRKEPITVKALDELALPAWRLARRGGAVDQTMLARLVAAALRYGSAGDRDRRLWAAPGVETDAEADREALGWCLFGLLRHPALRPVAGEPTFVAALDWPLPGAPARPVPRFVFCAAPSVRPVGRDPLVVRLGDGWSPDPAVFARAGELLAAKYLAELAATTQPDPSSTGPSPADTSDGHPFTERLGRLHPIDPTSTRSIADWCTTLLSAPRPESQMAQLEAESARLREDRAGREPERLSALRARGESAARLAAADERIRRLQADHDAAVRRAEVAEQAAAQAAERVADRVVPDKEDLAAPVDGPGARGADLAWVLLIVAVVELLVIAILTT
ncbi:hypothetical protein [Pseudofrankia sp. DC12]|uniref:hypothetical protein n=1 Tax=Pseudofrankia sp. DC12 TaxID=683315 RepID=UPI000A72C4CB|nr:hypothetical protein [Pseudofrankia sp. DC12]